MTIKCVMCAVRELMKRVNNWSVLIVFFSLLVLLLSLVFSFWYIARLPNDFWQGLENSQESFSYFSIHSLARNILAIILFFLGILLLFLPGQGVLTILTSLVVANFPYRTRMIIKLISNSKIQSILNKVRSYMGKENFKFPNS